MAAPLIQDRRREREHRTLARDVLEFPGFDTVIRGYSNLE